MDIFRFLLFIFVIVGCIAIFLTIKYFLNLFDRFERSSSQVSDIVREFAPVVARGTYLGLSIALIGAFLEFFVGSLWPIPVMVFFASVTGLVRKVLPRGPSIRSQR
jgi:hypothetical protein